jgi:hypothetical protein
MQTADPFSSPPDDPYRAPLATTKPGSPPGKLEYVRAWTFAFDSPQWAMNLLFGVIAMFIPAIGPMILNGYQFEVVERLHRSGGRSYPDFDFGRFADYLVRGLWVFLVTLVASIIVMPFMFVIVGGSTAVMIAAASSGSEEVAAVVFAIGLPLMMLLIVLVSAPLGLLMVPVVIRAGLMQDFGGAFNFDWIKSFISKTWKEVLLGTLFLAATGMLAGVAGMAIFCVGVYPATVLAFLAQAYMNYQYYELFLQRGGEPVPLKDPQQQGW